MDFNPPPEWQGLLEMVASQPEEVREMWQYAMVLMMIDNEKARIVETVVEETKTLVRVRTIGGEEIMIVRPKMSEELEQLLLEQIRQIVDKESLQ